MLSKFNANMAYKMADENGIFSTMSETSTKSCAENDQRVLDISYFRYLDFS